MKNQILNNALLRNQLQLLFLSNTGCRITSEYFNFRCNVCGDSKKTLKKKRAFIIFWNNKWWFKCHNCDKSMLAEKWFKIYHPQRYKQYVRDIISSSKPKYYQVEKIDTTKQKVNKPKEQESESFFIPITKGKTQIFKTAIRFCQERKIPEKIWNKWFVATRGSYGGRLIIPFYDNQKIYYYQARTLCAQHPKYLNRYLKNGEKQIYNIFGIDRTKPVTIFEGPIDSLFVKNSIAILGTHMSKTIEMEVNKLNTYFIFDNDEPGKKRSLQYLKAAKQVFIWKKFLKDLKLDENIKDMNEVIMQINKDGFEFKEIESYFSKSIFDGVYL